MKLAIMKITCSTCGIPKPEDMFATLDRGRVNERKRKQCKACTQTRARELRAEMGPTILRRIARKAESRKKQKEQNPELFLWRGARGRSRKFGRDFNITPEDIIIPKVCPIFKVPFTYGTGSINLYSPTLDRIDNSKGYIKGNIAVISYRANSMKAGLSLEEIKNLYKYSKRANGNI